MNPRIHEILSFLNCFYAVWSINPDFTFCELLEFCCGSDIPSSDRELAQRIGDRLKEHTKKLKQQMSEKPPALPKDAVDWTETKKILTSMMQTYSFPEATLKSDANGVEYWEEGWIFDERPTELMLDYRPGLDISEAAMNRVKFRQSVCDAVMKRVLDAALGS